MDEFYSGEDTEKRLVAVAYRAADSILRSTKYMLASLGHELLALFTVDTLWGLCLLAAGWFLASVISGPIGMAINLIFLAYGIYSSWGTIEQTYEQFKDWFWGFYSAKTEADLDKAGEHFAAAVVKGGVFALELVLTHRALKFASAKLVKRYPPPEKLRQRFAEETEQRAQRGQEQETRRAETEQRVPEAEATSRERKALQRLQALQKTLEAKGGVELGRELSGKLPDAGSVGSALLVALAGLGTVGLLALAAAAASEDEKRSRRR